MLAGGVGTFARPPYTIFGQFNEIDGVCQNTSPICDGPCYTPEYSHVFEHLPEYTTSGPVRMLHPHHAKTPPLRLQ